MLLQIKSPGKRIRRVDKFLKFVEQNRQNRILELKIEISAEHANIFFFVKWLRFSDVAKC